MSETVFKLGVLKLGAVYVPIDLKQPVRRLERLLSRSNIDFLVVDESATVPPALTRKPLRVDPKRLAGLARGVAELPTADRTAYIMHTSGSTGQPKAVAVSHASLLNLLGSIRLPQNPHQLGIDRLGGHVVRLQHPQIAL